MFTLSPSLTVSLAVLRAILLISITSVGPVEGAVSFVVPVGFVSLEDVSLEDVSLEDVVFLVAVAVTVMSPFASAEIM